MEWNENFTGLQHLGIPTTDIDETIAYYQMIGFTLAHETTNGTNRVAFLKWKDLVIETYESDQVSEVTGAGKLAEVDGTQNMDDVFAAIVDLLGE